MRPVPFRGEHGIRPVARQHSARVSLRACRGRAGFGLRAALLTGLIALLLAAPRLARAVDLDVLIGFGQSASMGAHYRPDTWTPITIYLSGQGTHGVGQLQVSVQVGTHTAIYTRRVALTDGPINQAEGFVVQLRSPDIYTFYAGPQPTEIGVRLLLDGRTLAGPKKVALPAPVAPETFNVLGLTRDGSGLNFLARKKFGLIHRHFNPANLGGFYSGQQEFHNGINPNATLQVLYTDPRALPAMPQGYTMIDAVALADQPLDNLKDDQIEALKSYVRQGGLLIISGGGDTTRLNGQFYKELLPITLQRTVLVNAIPELSQRYKTPLPLAGGTTLAEGMLKPAAYMLFADQSGQPLISARPYGDGIVVFTAFDYLDPSIRGWQGGPALWRDLLRCGNESVSPRDILAAAHDNPQGALVHVADALAGARASSAPPLTLLIVFCLAYLLLLVPVNYMVLKKVDRRELTWLTAPALIASFTLASYFFARSIKGGALTINRAVVLETNANTDMTAGYGLMTLYSPRRAAYDISPGAQDDPDNPYRLFCPSEVFSSSASGGGAEITVDNDQTGVTLRDTLIRLWDKRSFDIPVAASLGGSIDAITQAMPDGHGVKVTVTNRTRYALSHCAFIAGDNTIPAGGNLLQAGDLAPGASVTRTIPWSTRKAAYNIPISYGESVPDSPPDRPLDTPEATQIRIGNAMAQALSSGMDQSQNYVYNGVGEHGFGQAINGFAGWFNDPLLDVRVDGQPQQGQEVNLLLVHLPPPTQASPRLRAEIDPFAAPAVTELEDETKPALQGVLR